MKSFWCGVCFLFLAMTGQCLDKVGHAVAVQGIVKASNSEQEDRILQKNGDVFLGDTIMTEEMSKGQIKFTDGTMVLLIPGSSYSVNDYVFTHSWEKNRFAAKLHQGGLRIATGMIASKNPENFELGTPNATIGVRGTIFETNFVQGNLYVGSSSGKVTVTNSGGSLEVGSNHYAEVTSSDMAPQPLAQRPAALDPANFTPPQGGTSFASEAGASVGASNGFAWGPAVVGVVIIGAVVGGAAGMASSSSAH